MHDRGSVTLTAAAVSSSEMETGPEVALFPASAAKLPDAGYIPSIEPITLETLVPTGIGSLVMLLRTPFMDR